MMTNDDRMLILSDLIKKNGITVRDIVRNTNLTSSNFYKYTTGEKQITKDFALKLYNAYPCFIELAETFNDLVKIKSGKPFYNVDFCCGFDVVYNNQTTTPDGYIDIPQFNSADVFATTTGNSMQPLINSGDIIALKCVTIDDIMFGEIYGIITDQIRTIKRVRKSENKAVILLEPINIKEYDTTPMQLEKIIAIYQVVGCFKKF